MNKRCHGVNLILLDPRTILKISERSSSDCVSNQFCILFSNVLLAIFSFRYAKPIVKFFVSTGHNFRIFYTLHVSVPWFSKNIPCFTIIAFFLTSSLECIRYEGQHRKRRRSSLFLGLQRRLILKRYIISIPLQHFPSHHICVLLAFNPTLVTTSGSHLNGLSPNPLRYPMSELFCQYSGILPLSPKTV